MARAAARVYPSPSRPGYRASDDSPDRSRAARSGAFGGQAGGGVGFICRPSRLWLPPPWPEFSRSCSYRMLNSAMASASFSTSRSSKKIIRPVRVLMTLVSALVSGQTGSCSRPGKLLGREVRPVHLDHPSDNRAKIEPNHSIIADHWTDQIVSRLGRYRCHPWIPVAHQSLSSWQPRKQVWGAWVPTPPPGGRRGVGG